MPILKATSGRELPARPAYDMPIKDVAPFYDPFDYFYLTNLTQIVGPREGI